MARRQREVAAREPRLGVAGAIAPHQRPKPMQDEGRVGDEQDGLGGLVEPEVRPEPALEQHDPGRRRRARASRGSRSGGRPAAGSDGPLRVVRDDERRLGDPQRRAETGGERLVDRRPRVGGPGPARSRRAMPAARTGAGMSRTLLRLEDVVDRVVDHDRLAAGAARLAVARRPGRARSSGCRRRGRGPPAPARARASPTSRGRCAARRSSGGAPRPSGERPRATTSIDGPPAAPARRVRAAP